MTADTISTRQFVRGVARKLSHRGVLPALIGVERLKDTTVDSLGRQLELAAQRWPDRPSVKFEGGQWTWSQFNRRVNRYAHTLRDAGIGDGDVVAVDVANSAAMLAATMAVLKLGGVAALVNTTLRGDALEHCLNIVDPVAVVVGEELLDAIGPMPHDTVSRRWIYLRDTGTTPAPDGWLDLDRDSEHASTADPSSTAQLTLGHPAVYIYTSGTTGLPKAASSPHRRLRMGGLVTGRALLELTPSDAVYCPLPLYHSTGFLGGWSACLHSGAALVPARKFSASTFWDDIRAHDITAFVYVGEMLRYLVNRPPSPRDRDHRVRAVYGAGLRAEIWDEFKRRFGIPTVCELYGASESPSGFMNFFNFDRTAGWNPRGWKAVEYDRETQAPARDADGFLTAVGPGEVGLLIMQIAAHQPFAGYTDAAATEQKVLRDVFKSGDAWFDTGDLVLNQGHGHVRFVDRTGDTFRWRGENVATTEVEGVVNRWPQVEDCTVYGVQVPGAEGRAGMAWVQLAAEETLDLSGFADHLRSTLPGYAVPRFLRVGEQAAVTGTMKHKKVDLRDQAYDLASVGGEPVYLLRPGDDAWVELTTELQSAVDAGTERL